MTAVKICGITSLEDARCAAEAGADFLGFIFYPPSPRYIAPQDAGRIASALRAELGSGCPRFVGVFVDEAMEALRDAIRDAHLDLVQLHGDEPVTTVNALSPIAFKALRPRSLTEAETALATYARLWTAVTDDALSPHLLVDAYHPDQHGGTGTQADTALACYLAARCRVMLAGGLTPGNVAEAVAAVRPWGVDVSSGVEQAKGVKDHARVRAFVEAVRAEERAHTKPMELTI